MTAGARLVGRVSESIRQQPQVLDYTALLERDLGIEQDANERLRERVKSLKSQLERANARIDQQQNEIIKLITARRTNKHILQGAAPAIGNASRVSLGRLNIDVALRLIEFDGKSEPATPHEVLMMAFLAQRPDTTISTAALASAIKSSGAEAIRTYMHRLRKKLDRLGATAYLQSNRHGGVYGGYWMTDPEATS